MKIPSKNTSTAELRKLQAYTTAQLKADADTKDLAPALATAWEGLAQADAHYLERETVLLSLMALRDRADGEADDLLRRLYRELQGLEGGRGMGTNGKLIFPRGLTAVTSTPIKDQPGEMRIVAGKVAATANERISGYAQAIEDKATNLRDRNDEYEASVEQVGIAFSDVLRSRLDWIRIYEKTFGELVVRLGKAKAERYFKKAGKGKRAKKTAPTA